MDYPVGIIGPHSLRGELKRRNRCNPLRLPATALHTRLVDRAVARPLPLPGPCSIPALNPGVGLPRARRIRPVCLREPLAGVENEISDRDAQSSAALLRNLKYADRQILNREIASRSISRLDPALQRGIVCFVDHYYKSET